MVFETCVPFKKFMFHHFPVWDKLAASKAMGWAAPVVEETPPSWHSGAQQAANNVFKGVGCPASNNTCQKGSLKTKNTILRNQKRHTLSHIAYHQRVVAWIYPFFSKLPSLKVAGSLKFQMQPLQVAS